MSYFAKFGERSKNELPSSLYIVVIHATSCSVDQVRSFTRQQGQLLRYSNSKIQCIAATYISRFLIGEGR